MSKIKYLDYNSDEMDYGMVFYPTIHKQKAYSYEDEVRIFYEKTNVIMDSDWLKEDVYEGVYIKTDLNILIDEIIISPYAPNWFSVLVQDI